MLKWLKKTFGETKTSRTPQELPEPSVRVRKLVAELQIIEAIKTYREENAGVGLKEAKDVVDALRQ